GNHGRGEGEHHGCRPDRSLLRQDRSHAARELMTMDFIQTTFLSFVSLIPVTLAQSLILSFVVLGIMIPFRTLNFPDLTSEGAFPLGGCVCGVLLASGASPVTAIVVALLAGFVAGCCTAFIHLRFRIHTLLAG